MPDKRRGNQAGRNPAGADRRSRRRGWRRRLAGFELLEDRRLLATLTVNTLVDENNGVGTGGVSLREAVAAAAPNDTISFSVTGTINLTSAGTGHIVVNKNLTIQGPGANLLTVKAHDPDASGNNDSDGHRVFYVSGNGTLNVTISGLTLTNGDPDVSNEENAIGGGAIHNEENLSLVNCILSGNSAEKGGAILNLSGALNITNCTITGNAAVDGGGVFVNEGSITITSSTVSNNQVTNSGGGVLALNSSTSVTVTNSTISGNSATERGGGIYSYGGLSVSGSTISGNIADANNDASGNGGGIFLYNNSLTITNSIISGNSTMERGGGIYFNTGQTVTISDSVITQNSATQGGGIRSSGNLSILRSTLSGNNASSRGGGIFHAADDLIVINSTISGNSANSQGGGVYTSSEAAVILSHTTISSNTVGGSGSGGGIAVKDDEDIADPDLVHTIVAGNIRGTSTRDDVLGTFDASFSLIGDRRSNTVNNIGGTSLIGTSASPINAMLGPLANNAGPTMTHALLTGSPAIDSGNMSAVAGVSGIPLSDQRGLPFSRVADGDGVGGVRIDIGAVEMPPLPDLPGDFNLNNVVDAADYVLWRRTQGTNVPQYSGADGDGNGIVNSLDYAVWRAHFGEAFMPAAGSATSASAAPPPPATESETQVSDDRSPVPAETVEPKASSKSPIGAVFKPVAQGPASAVSLDLLLALEPADSAAGEKRESSAKPHDEAADVANAFDAALAAFYDEPAASVGVEFDAP